MMLHQSPTKVAHFKKFLTKVLKKAIQKLCRLKTKSFYLDKKILLDSKLKIIQKKKMKIFKTLKFKINL